MLKDIIARRYAKALLSLASQAGKSDEVRADLEAVAAMYGSSRDLQEVFLNPSFGAEDRAGVLKGLVSQMKLSELSGRFIVLLGDKGRFRYIREAAASYAELLDLAQGRVKATVTTATALSDAEVAKLSAKVATLVGKTVELDVEVDPSLIGGIKTRIGSTVYDGSLKNQMAKMRSALLG